MLNVESIFNHYNIFYSIFTSDLSSQPQSKLNFGTLTTSPECNVGCYIYRQCYMSVLLYMQHASGKYCRIHLLGIPAFWSQEGLIEQL